METGAPFVLRDLTAALSTFISAGGDRGTPKIIAAPPTYTVALGDTLSNPEIVDNQWIQQALWRELPAYAGAVTARVVGESALATKDIAEKLANQIRAISKSKTDAVEYVDILS